MSSIRFSELDMLSFHGPSLPNFPFIDNGSRNSLDFTALKSVVLED